MSERLEFLAMRGAAAAVAWLPPRAALHFGRWVGRGAFHLGVRRRVSRDNLGRAFGSTRTIAELDHLARAAYEHLGTSFVEFLRLPRLTPAALRDGFELCGEEHLRAALARGRGAIVASGHLGNWEWMGAALAARGYPVTFVVQTLRNRRVDAFVQDIRRGTGIDVLTRGMELRRVGEALAANRLVFFMCDQDARRRGVFVPFFGVPASTPKGAAQFALRMQVPFVPGFGSRLPDGRHRGTIFPPVVAAAGEEDMAVCELLTAFNRCLEEAVRAAPEQYWWAHRRWKTKPPPASSPAPGVPVA
jgi:Kdo2-lipid IVA lauroyltransferase/acyltransferase